MTQHTSRLCKGYLTKKESDGVLHQIIWPPQSPDLNPVEMVWDELDCRVNPRQCHQQSTPTPSHLLFHASRWESLMRRSPVHLLCVSKDTAVRTKNLKFGLIRPEWRKCSQLVLSICENSFKTVGKAFLMKLVERIPRVRKAVIKEKGGYFEEFEIYF